ncbi:MAG: sel1 repeat family protein [Rhodospirillaceae bacterium]|nr:sel1 repeat family protein [Rhodospirillaceae bacterium]
MRTWKAMVSANVIFGLAGFIVTAFFCSSAQADAYDDAIAASKRRDYETAVQLIQPLADAGDARAQNVLGYFYDHGLGVPVDHERAFNWYMSAAKQGNAGAELNLCASYAKGTGVEQDVKEGMRWCFVAAKKNLAEAHFNLGNTYAVGEYGLAQDDVRSYMHYKLALEHSEEPLLKKFASESIEYLHRNMSQADIAKAEMMAAAWPQELP